MSRPESEEESERWPGAAMPRSMPISILGTGAMAMLFGARLARAGYEITLYGSWPAALQVMGERGIDLEGSSGADSVPVRALELAEYALDSGADLILVLAKGRQTARIATALEGLGSKPTEIVTLQNGLGNQETLQAKSGFEVLSGVTTSAARVLAPGRVLETGTGETLLPRRARLTKTALAEAGFKVRSVDPIEPWVWLKLAVNCAINPVSAIEGVRNGELLRLDAPRLLMETAAEEVEAVAAAREIVLPTSAVEEVWRVAAATSENFSSMLSDLHRGVPTEIEALSGAVGREGRKLGVATPTNDYLFESVRRLEARATRDRDAREVTA